MARGGILTDERQADGPGPAARALRSPSPGRTRPARSVSPALALLLLLGGAGTLAGHGLPEDLAPLWPAWAPGGSGPGTAGLLRLYLALPLAGLASGFLLLAPGLALALAFLRPRSLAEWLLKGLALSLPLLCLLPPLAEAAAGAAGIGGAPLRGAGFAAFLLLLGGAALLLLRGQERRGRVDAAFLAGRGRDLAAMILLPLALLVLLAPKVAIESANGDGAHALLAAEHLIHAANPFWPANSGPVDSHPSMTAMLDTLVNSWFVRLFGFHEAAPRIAGVLLTGLLLPLLLSLARKEETGPDATPTPLLPLLAIAGACALTALTLAFDTSYDPFFADMALPMAREPLVLAAFLGFAVFLARKDWPWVAAFALLTHISVPSGLLLMGFWLAANFLAGTPRPWGQSFAAGFILIGCIVLVTLAPLLVERAGLGVMSTEFGSGNILRRLRYLTFESPERLLWWAVPGGLLPALSLLAWGWLDRTGRTVALTCIAFAGFFHFQAYRILPHHFAPLMLLPLIAFWRMRVPGGRAGETGRALAALAGLALALPLAAPPGLFQGRLPVHVQGQDFAARIDTGGPAEFDAASLRRTSLLLAAAFPPDYAGAGGYTGSSLAWYVLALRPKPEGQRTDWRIEPDSGPAAGEILARDEGWRLTELRPGARAEETARRDLPVTIAPLFRVPAAQIFGPMPEADPRHVIDLARLAGLR